MASALLVWRFWLGLHLVGILIGLFTLITGLAKRRVFLAASGAIVAFPLACIVFVDVSTQIRWSGEFTITADVTVVDANFESPVENASVSITWTLVNPDEADVVTDAKGTAKYSKDWPYGGRSSGCELLYGGEPSYCDLHGYALHVSADGYSPFVQPLDKMTGINRLQRPDDDLPALTVRIERKASQSAGQITADETGVLKK